MELIICIIAAAIVGIGVGKTYEHNISHKPLIETVITDQEAGYDQASYDECRDSFEDCVIDSNGKSCESSKCIDAEKSECECICSEI